MFLWERAVVAPYRFALHPLTTHFITCRLRPTCSAYSVQAVHTHGFAQGIWLTVKRLVRCNPWTPQGTYDPVPAPALSR